MDYLKKENLVVNNAKISRIRRQNNSRSIFSPGKSKGGVSPNGGGLKSVFGVMADDTVAKFDEPSGNGICDKDVFGFGPAFSIGKPGAETRKKLNSRIRNSSY